MIQHDTIQPTHANPVRPATPADTYEPPAVVTLGSLAELTRGPGGGESDGTFSGGSLTY
jgi:hypothetical protein